MIRTPIQLKEIRRCAYIYSLFDLSENKFQTEIFLTHHMIVLWVQNEDRRPKNEDPFKIVSKSL